MTYDRRCREDFLEIEMVVIESRFVCDAGRVINLKGLIWRQGWIRVLEATGERLANNHSTLNAVAFEGSFSLLI